MPVLLSNGFYATDVGVIRVKHVDHGKLVGKVILFMCDVSGNNYDCAIQMRMKSFAFLEPDNSVRFFLAFAASNTQVHLDAIRKAVAEVVERYPK